MTHLSESKGTQEMSDTRQQEPSTQYDIQRPKGWTNFHADYAASTLVFKTETGVALPKPNA